jgi:hypothetical protein
MLAGAILGGCNNSSSNLAVTGSPFDPVRFFTGHTHGEARLRLITRASRHVSVDSVGTPDGRGGLTLDQAIQEERQPARTRRWVIRPAGPSRWTGTLTDATGPVAIERTPSDVVIRYRMKSGPEVEQHLQLPPGAMAWNHMTVSRFGIRVATLDEQVRKLSR